MKNLLRFLPFFLFIQVGILTACKEKSKSSRTPLAKTTKEDPTDEDPDDDGDDFTGTLSITNLHDKQTVNSGFMYGTASQDATIGCQFDNGTIVSATGTTTWKCPLPVASSSWTLGSSRNISVGYLVSGALQNSISINVIVGSNEDINGDGYSDLVAAAREYDAGALKGRVYVFYSGADSFASDTDAANADSIITGENDGDTFGFSLKVDDVNHDGYADVLVAATRIASDAGKLYIFYSDGASGLPSSVAASAADASISGANASDFFGTGLVTGDFNGDGYTDIVASSSGLEEVYIFYGSSTEMSGAVSLASAGSVITGENSGDSFGYPLCMGDVNNDGKSDLAIGAPAYNGGGEKGRTYVFLGDTSGLGASISASTADSKFTGNNDGDGLANSLAIGDFNGDSYADLAIGGYVNDEGEIYVFLSSASGLPASAVASGADSVFSGIANSYFSNSLEAADLDRDGFADLIVGARGSGILGRAYVYYGANIGFDATPSTSDADAVFEANATSDRFGFALTSSDFDGDGLFDVIVGATGFNAGGFKGRAYLFNSTTARFTGTISASASDATFTGTTNADRFGSGFSIGI